MSDIERSRPEQRPPIVLTALDHEKLFALLGDALMSRQIRSSELGCDVKFVDHADARVRRARLVLPEQAQCNHCISVLSPIGSVLIGLGPGQSIRCKVESEASRFLKCARAGVDHRRNAR